MKEKAQKRPVRLEISSEVLQIVFEECDRYDDEETGGRIVGHFDEDGQTLVVRAVGVIEPGPRARRTSASFFQDGDYQTEVFRRIEAVDSTIEHLGNWHTHHVNGYPTLSGGDIATYRRIVNHELHNTNFFYALLVTKRRDDLVGLDRYEVRHYVLFRGSDIVYEVHKQDIRMTDAPRVWPPRKISAGNADIGEEPSGNAKVRAHDQDVLAVIYPSLVPRLSRRTDTFFWKGSLTVIDGSEVEVRIVEVEDDVGQLRYYPFARGTTVAVEDVCRTPFDSASEAVRALELRVNTKIYQLAVERNRRRS